MLWNCSTTTLSTAQRRWLTSKTAKGDFFNDLLALILENCAEVSIWSRRGVPGFIMPTHSLDITHPSDGVKVPRGAAKALGTPKHPGAQEEGPMGHRGRLTSEARQRSSPSRPSTSKWSMDESRSPAWRPPIGQSGWQPDHMAPDRGAGTFLFISARVIGATDLYCSRHRLWERAAQVEDGVGIFCYRPARTPRRRGTEAVATIPTGLQLERTLHRACEDLLVIKSEALIPLPTAVIDDAAETEAWFVRPQVTSTNDSSLSGDR